MITIKAWDGQEQGVTIKCEPNRLHLMVEQLIRMGYRSIEVR